MKNKLLLSVTTIILCVLPVISLAETSTSTDHQDRKTTIKEEVEAKKETIKQNLQTKKEEIKNSVEKTRQNATNKIVDRINQFVQNIITRYEAAINRLETLSARIDSRITKMEDKNIDVTIGKDLLAIARTKIETAKISTAGIASTTDNMIFGTTTAAVKENFQAIKTQIEKAKEDIKAAHAALVDVVSSLKPGDNKLRNSSASSTATTSEEHD